MKKKKLIIISLILISCGILFLSVNKYLLNNKNRNVNDNSSDYSNQPVINEDKNDNTNEDNKTTEIKEDDKTNSNSQNNSNNQDNKENFNSQNEDKNNESKNNSSTNSKPNTNSSQNTSSNSEQIDAKLTQSYPKLAKVSGDEETVGTTKNGFKITNVSGVTYIDDIMVVNKTYGLPSDYLPVNTVESCQGKTSTCNKCINKFVYSSFKTMQADAKAVGLNIYIASGYRPYVSQESIYNRYIKRDGKVAADTYSARPGYSEHQTSYTFDLNSINDSFAYTDEGKWVNENAYLYGFIIRFPKGKDKYTGYKYEPWHLRYVGYELAKKLYNDGDWISLEEYFGVDSKYQD